MKKRIFLLAVILMTLWASVVFAQPKTEVAKPIILGFPVPLGFEAGRSNQRGINLAVDEINSAGGVNVGGKKRPFKVNAVDSRDIEPGIPVSDVLLVIEKLILDAKVDFIIAGPARTEASLPTMDLQYKYKVISLNCMSLSPAVGAKVAKDYDKYKYFFSMTNKSNSLIMNDLSPSIQDIGKKFGINKAFIILQDVAHARIGGEIMEKVLKEGGWEIVGREIYPTGTTDFSSGLLKARAAGRSILFLWGEMPEFTILMKQWHDMKIPTLPIGMVVFFSDPGLWKATEGKCAYIMSDSVSAGNVPSKATPWTMKFVEAYKKRWGMEPEFHGTAESYMAPYVLKDAIERAGTLDTENLIKALEQTDLIGVYGRMRFDPKTHVLIYSIDPKEGAVGTVFQWQDGKRVAIYPPSIRMGEVKLPPWMK